MSRLFFILFPFLFAIKVQAIDVTIGSSAPIYVTNGTNDHLVFQNAINFVSLNGGGSVNVQNGIYFINAQIVPKNNVTLIGESTSGTILKGNIPYGNTITNAVNPFTTLFNFHIKNMTFDANHVNSASNIRLQYAKSCSFDNLKFINVACNGWHLVLGIDGNEAAFSNAVSRDCVIKNCIFDGHTGSLEMLLLFNCKNTLVESCEFKNKTNVSGCSQGNSPVVGLWQKTDSIYFKNCIWKDNYTKEGLYLSNTSNNTYIDGCNFNNSGGIRGTNPSDFGDFGVVNAKNLIVKNSTFVGGTLVSTLPGIQLGGIKNVLIKDCNITNFEEGVLIDKGYSAISEKTKHWAILRTSITRNNINNNVHDLHPGILMQTFAGALDGFIICGQITDNRTPLPFQYRPISHYMNTAAVFDSIHILGTTMQGYPGGELLKFLNGTTQGSNYLRLDCINTPSYCGVCPNITDADAISKIQFYDPITANIITGLNQFAIPSQILPLRLLSFQVENYNKNNLIRFKTIDEVNVKVIDVEHSSDGIRFQKIGVMKPKKSTEYQFMHKNIIQKLNYYRLKTINNDLTFEYSKIVSVENNLIKDVELNYNRNTQMFDFRGVENDDAYSIIVFDSQGQMLFIEKSDAQVPILLSSGIYFIKITDLEGNIWIKKIGV